MTKSVFLSCTRDGKSNSGLIVSIFRNHGVTTRDSMDVPTGPSWAESLADLISGTDAVVAIISPSYSESDEASYELALSMAANKIILPVIVTPGAPVPLILRPFATVDMPTGTPPGSYLRRFALDL